MAKIKIDDLNEVDYNPRVITKKELNRLKRSIKEHSSVVFGDGYRLTATITINKQGNRIIGGHQRIKALKELGQDWIDSSDITWVDIEPNSKEEKKLNIVLNDNFGEFDKDKLEIIIEEIKVNNIELFDNLVFKDFDFSKVVVEVEKVEEIKKEVKKDKKVIPEIKEQCSGKFVLNYKNEEEKKFWKERGNLDSDKVVWSFQDF